MRRLRVGCQRSSTPHFFICRAKQSLIFIIATTRPIESLFGTPHETKSDELPRNIRQKPQEALTSCTNSHSPPDKGFPISQWCPNGSTIRPMRQSY